MRNIYKEKDAINCMRKRGKRETSDYSISEYKSLKINKIKNFYGA